MRFNKLTNAFDIEIKDYTDVIYENIRQQEYHPITVRFATGRGFKTDVVLSKKTGIYVLYKDEQALYVGASDSCIHNRISRFISGVRGTESKNETHYAAYKYRSIFSTNFDNFSFKYFILNDAMLYKPHTIFDVENSLNEVVSKVEILYNVVR